MEINKKLVLQKIIAELEREISAVRQSFTATKQAAIEAPGAMQSHSDTTKFQMNVLSDNIKRSLEEKEIGLRELKQLALNDISASGSVGLCALVEVQELDGKVSFFFILPGGGGIRVVNESHAITVIVPNSPLARVFIGKRVGEEAIFESPVTKQTRKFTIVNVW